MGMDIIQEIKKRQEKSMQTLSESSNCNSRI